MEIIELDVKSTFDTLDKLRSLDLRETDASTIKELLKQISKHIGIKQKILKDRFIQRGVLLDDEKDDFYPKTIQRISYNPNGSSQGRANFEGESVFYGCIATEIMEAYNCTATELIPETEEGLHRHRFVIGNWLLAEDTEFLMIGGDNSLNSVCEAGVSRNNSFQQFVRTYKEAIIPLFAIDRFLCNEFSKKVGDDEPWEYKISASYVQILKEQGEPGLIYPSVKSEGAGLNIVIFPDKVNSGLIAFDRALYGTFYKRNLEICNEYTLRATATANNLVWKEEYFRLHKSIKDYYTGVTNYNPLEGRVPMRNLGRPINLL